MSSNITVLQADPSTFDTSLAGANLLQSSYVRTDISGFTNPSINYTGSLLMKGNFTASGLWAQNN